MKLVLAKQHVATLRSELIKPDDNERFAYLYCSHHNEDLLPTELHVVQDNEMATIQPAACRPQVDVERRHIETCIDHGLIPVMVHSHPFSPQPQFSGRDRKLITKHSDWLTQLYPDHAVGFAVIGTQGIEAELHTADDEKHLPVVVRGNWKLQPPVPTEDPSIPTAVDTERYDRNARLFTAEGQQQLHETAVAVVGVGGLGSMVAEELARLGVGELTLIDPDRVERSNLPRLVGATEHDVDESKVDVVHHRMFEANPDVDVTAVATPVEENPAALQGADVILGCVDQVSARLFLNEYSVKHLQYYVDAGSRIDTDRGTVEAINGYLQLVAPGATACFDCLDRWNPETVRREHLSDDELKAEIDRGYIDEAELAPEPAVVFLNGVMASLLVSTVTKLVTGYTDPPDFLRYDGLNNEVTEIVTTPIENCITCGRMLGQTHHHDVDYTTLQQQRAGASEVDLQW